MSVGVKQEVVRLDVAVDEPELVNVLDGKGRFGNVKLKANTEKLFTFLIEKERCPSN